MYKSIRQHIIDKTGIHGFELLEGAIYEGLTKKDGEITRVRDLKATISYKDTLIYIEFEV